MKWGLVRVSRNMAAVGIVYCLISGTKLFALTNHDLLSLGSAAGVQVPVDLQHQIRRRGMWEGIHTLRNSRLGQETSLLFGNSVVIAAVTWLLER